MKLVNHEDKKDKPIVKLWGHPCKILTEISARILASFWPARLPRSRRDLEISAAKNWPRFLPRSRWVLKISSRFSMRSWQDLKNSAAKNSPRFSPRSQNLASQNLTENLDKISSKILARSQSLGGQNLGKTSSKILSRYQNLGGQNNLAERTVSFLGNVSKIF